jgi:type II secretory pathway pseudopilin PulG
MVEIAISLAVIGIALVAIIGVLPLGMRVQRDNREQTVINQDATVFMEAIRNGARGLDDLTNYVYLITNIVTTYNNAGQPQSPPKTYGYTYTGSTFNGAPMTPPFPITNGLRIIGLLSTPEYTDPVSDKPQPNVFGGGNSNHITAYVYSMSGPAVEKPPQANDSIIRQDSFNYRVLCVNAPLAVDTNMPSAYQTNLLANLHELRLSFLWPQLPNGSLGLGRQTYRATVAGQLVLTNDTSQPSQPLYFYQPQSFINATNGL